MEKDSLVLKKWKPSVQFLSSKLETTKLEDLEFTQTGGKLGKGAYGQVELAFHKRCKV